MRDRIRFGAQDGFTTVVVMSALLLGVMVSEIAYKTVLSDIKPAQASQDRKEAYAAAEAGVNVYAYQLTRDPNLWTKCTNVPPPNGTEASPIVQQWTGVGADTRTGHWRKLPDSPAQYAIELLPATGYTSCIAANAASMMNPTNGTIRIRSTGIMNGKKRSVIAMFRRTKFLDFLYFTDFETSDPVTYSDSTSQAYAAAHCVVYYPNRDSSCTRIQFADADVVAGPLHTNDELLTCDSPQFGRTTADIIEVVGPTPGYVKNCGSSVPDTRGTWVNPANALTMPTTNSSLSAIAASGGLKFTNGTQKIVLSGTSMTVTGPTGVVTHPSMPANGVIYVANSSCGTSGYARTQNYTNPTGCGDLWISGTTSVSLTLATDNDIIVNGDLLTTGDAELGLIANNFVRVYHPVTLRVGDTCTNSASSPTNVDIDAAILSLQHSFIVDNWYCGASLGTLTVFGAIAQKFRGPVGTSGSGSTGYTKAYTYDDRLRYTNPPSFLDPVASALRVVRQTEQVPAR